MATPHDDAAGIKVENISASRSRQCPRCGLSVPGTIDTCPNDGTQLGNKLAPGDSLLGRYEFIEVIGEGGMGVVYKARHPDLQRLYAIKMLHSHLAGVNAAGRFLLEARAASGLSHPNIIAIHDYGSDTTGRQYIVMEYLQGKDLSSRIAEGGALPLDDALDLFQQICEGLAHAHKNGVVHRDLKPSNIVLCTDDTGRTVAKLVDFGLAKVVSEEGENQSGSGPALTRTGDVIGSPPYMSPEQCKGLTLDARTDIYSLGCLMYEALTGQTPFTATSTMALVFKHMEEAAPTLAAGAPARSFPPALEALIEKCLAKRRADRFQTMDEVKRALEAVRRGGWAMSPTQKRWLISGSAIVGGALLVGLAAFFLLSPPEEKGSTRAHSTSKDPAVLKEAVSAYFDGRQFKVGDKRCTDEWMPYVAELRALRRLILSHTAVTDEGMKALEKSNAPIEYADLDQLQGVSDGSMKVLSRFPLRYLNIQQTDVGDEGLKYIGQMKSLENLQMARIVCSRKGLEYLTELPDLKIVDLTQLPNFTPDWFDTIVKMKSLDTLDIEGDTIHDGLSKLGALTKLRALEMHEIPPAQNPKFLSYLPVMPSLQGIDLQEDTLTAEDFAAIAKQPNVVELNLAYTRFQPDDLQVLRDCKKLQMVDLNNSTATMDGVMALKAIASLKRVYIIGCQNLSPEDLVRIQQEFAPVEVVTEKKQDIL